MTNASSKKYKEYKDGLYLKMFIPNTWKMYLHQIPIIHHIPCTSDPKSSKSIKPSQKYFEKEL